MSRYLPGDVVSRRKGLVMHKGVVLRDGRILHNTPFRGEHICTEDEFRAGKRLHTTRMARHERRRALHHAENGDRRSYNLLTNNCEHFVRWCRLGVARSDQSESARKRLVSSLGRTACRQVVRCASRRWAAPLASRALRGGGWLLLADGAQWVTELAARERGQDVPRARRIAQVAGAGVAVGVGTCLAGPVGAAIGLGSWVSGELIQSYAVSGRE